MHIRNSLMVVLLSFCMTAPTLLLAGGGPNVNGAKLYIKQGKIKKAIEVLEEEINEVDANNEDAWYLLGYIYARQRKYDKMLEAFNKATELEPNLKKEGIDISGDSGRTFHADFGADRIMRIIWGETFNAAVKHFNDGINAPDDSTRIQSFETAAKQFKTSAEILPDSTMSYRNWAASLMNLGKYEESTKPLKAALEYNPEDTAIKTMLAQVYMTSGADSLAVPILEEMWESGDRSVEVADALSRAYIRAGENEKAKQIYKDVLESNPDNYQFRYNYGTVLLEADEFDEAIEQLSKAQEMNPDAADINYNLGAAYLNRGVVRRDSLPEDSEDLSYREDFKKALPYLEKSIAINPDDAHIWITLGQIAGQLNKPALAGYAFSKGEELKSALDEQVVVGMDGAKLKEALGEPSMVKEIESDQFSNVKEWSYNKRKGTNGKLAIPKGMVVYVKDGVVDAIMVAN